MTPPFSVRPDPRYLLMCLALFPFLIAAGVWGGAFEGWRHAGVGRAFSALPFVPQVVMVILVTSSLAGLGWLFRIRPPRPILAIVDGEIVAQSFWWVRRCPLNGLSSVKVIRFRRIDGLELQPLVGRRIRVGAKILDTTWTAVADRIRIDSGLQEMDNTVHASDG